jgi:lipoprotein-anchoring transpeptidase ErfK/SrfK
MRAMALMLALGLVASPQLRAGQRVPTSAQGSGPPAPGAPVLSETVAAQVMLDRAGFSPGEIDGRQGSNFTRAIRAYQSSRNLEPSGQLDDDAWRRLQQDTGQQPPLVDYAVTGADIAGPFTPDIPSDLIEQSKLGALGYRNLLEALAERFHASPDLLTALNPGATFDSAGEQLTVPNVGAVIPDVAPSPATPKPASAGAGGRLTVIVTKASGALTLEDAAHRVVFHAPVTSGSQHDPLPIGVWQVNGVQQNPSFHYNPALFWDANPAHAKATLAPGPNNPVGTVWIDISKPHYGIHGTPEPASIGHVESHGCVRLTNWDAQRVAAMVRPGTKVIFR